MPEQKFRIVILGRLAEGADRAQAGAILAELFDVPPQRVDRLLEGKRLPLRKELSGDEADSLRGRLQAAGIPAEVEPVAELSLEEPVGAEAGEAGEEEAVTEIEATAVGGFAAGLEPRAEKGRAAELARERSSARPQASRSGLDDDGDGGLEGHEVFVDQRMASGWPGGDAADAVADEERGPSRLLLTLGAVAVLAVLALGAYLWLGGDDPAPPETVLSPAPTEAVSPDSPRSEAQRRLEELGRSVKVWMIQFGVGYDPTQVTLGRLRNDLAITDEQLHDPWGTEMRYRAEADAFQVVSAGPDRRFGTGDDLSLEGKL